MQTSNAEKCKTKMWDHVYLCYTLFSFCMSAHPHASQAVSCLLPSVACCCRLLPAAGYCSLLLAAAAYCCVLRMATADQNGISLSDLKRKYLQSTSMVKFLG